mmetsp:Transcript_21884/g.37673  ORF Transcript_21884/g.37673 Transcript_21884/m.37673 type:complete len:365 (-) Transcript_21884:283-1377(-)
MMERYRKKTKSTDGWTVEEEQMMMDLYMEYGSDWQIIIEKLSSNGFPRRTQACIQKRRNTITRRMRRRMERSNLSNVAAEANSRGQNTNISAFSLETQASKKEETSVLEFISKLKAASQEVPRSASQEPCKRQKTSTFDLSAGACNYTHSPSVSSGGSSSGETSDGFSDYYQSLLAQALQAPSQKQAPEASAYGMPEFYHKVLLSSSQSQDMGQIPPGMRRFGQYTSSVSETNRLALLLLAQHGRQQPTGMNFHPHKLETNRQEAALQINQINFGCLTPQQVAAAGHDNHSDLRSLMALRNLMGVGASTNTPLHSRTEQFGGQPTFSSSSWNPNLVSLRHLASLVERANNGDGGTSWNTSTLWR